MNSIMQDVWGYISNFINDNKHTCNLLMTCKEISHFNIYFREAISIKKIVGHQWYDKFINIIVDAHIILMPLHIKRLVLNGNFCRSENFRIPSTVTHLVLYRNFILPIYQNIPTSVTHLEFGSNFNKDLCGCIPSSVIHLRFGDNFNQPIRDYTSEMNSHFSIMHSIIPPSVINLEFRRDFNQPIHGCIPSSVKYLQFGEKFNQPIHGCIPSSVTYLKFSTDFKQPIDIPSSVTKLCLFEDYDKLDFDKLPTSITHLTLTGNHTITNIPSSIVELVVRSFNSVYCSRTIDKEYSYKPCKQSNITHLILRGIIRDSLVPLPTSVEYHHKLVRRGKSYVTGMFL